MCSLLLLLCLSHLAQNSFTQRTEVVPFMVLQADAEAWQNIIHADQRICAALEFFSRPLKRLMTILSSLLAQNVGRSQSLFKRLLQLLSLFGCLSWQVYDDVHTLIFALGRL